MGRYTLIILAALIFTLGYFVITTNRSKQRVLESTVDSFEARTLEDMSVSGARIALRKLEKDISWRTNDYSLALQNTDIGIEVMDRTDNPNLRKGEVLVRATSELYDEEIDFDKQAVTEVVVRVGSVFSNHAWVIDDLGSTNLANGVEIYGGFHTNNDLNIARSPVFHGEITATGNVNYDKNNTPVLPVGYADKVEINLDFSEMVDPANYTRKFIGDTDFFFNGDGTASVDGVTWTLPETGILYFTDDVTVKGVVDKDITIYTLGEIYIPADIVYRDSTQDMLTLLAEGNLLVRAKVDTTMTIQANMYTRGADGLVFMTDKNNPWAVTHKAHFEFFGALVQYGLQPLHPKRKELPFGTSSNSDKQFHFVMRHDSRLEEEVPQGMPRRFNVVSWNEY